jgi:hypothetical protein
MHRNAWILFLGVLVALVVAAPAAAAALNGPVVKTVTKQLPIREGKVTESKVRCPGTMVAIAGSLVKLPASATFRKSLPSGARTWRFAFGGFVGATSHKATVNVRCVGLSVPTRAGQVALNVNTVSHGLGVNALDRAETRIDCRKGYVPTAWGFDIPAPSTTQNVLPPEELQVYKALADSRGFAFGLENLGAGGNVARLRVRCLQRTAAGKAGLSHTWQITHQRRSQRIRSGVRTVRRSCASLSLSVGLGHSIDPAGDVIFRRSYDGKTRSAAWVFDNGSGIDRVTTQLLCLSTITTFH